MKRGRASSLSSSVSIKGVASVCRSVEISWLIAALYNHLDKNTDRDAYAK